MEKTATLNLRVNPTVKERAEKVLSQLGVPMSTAIDMYLNQISLTGGIPFSVSLPKAPVSIHADAMTTEEILCFDAHAFCAPPRSGRKYVSSPFVGYSDFLPCVKLPCQ